MFMADVCPWFPRVLIPWFGELLGACSSQIAVLASSRGRMYHFNYYLDVLLRYIFLISCCVLL